MDFLKKWLEKKKFFALISVALYWYLAAYVYRLVEKKAFKHSDFVRSNYDLYFSSKCLCSGTSTLKMWFPLLFVYGVAFLFICFQPVVLKTFWLRCWHASSCVASLLVPLLLLCLLAELHPSPWTRTLYLQFFVVCTQSWM